MNDNPKYVMYRNKRIPRWWEDYLPEEKNLMAYIREEGGQRILVAGNFDRNPKVVTIPSEGRLLLNNLEEAPEMCGETLRLAGYQAVVLEL